VLKIAAPHLLEQVKAQSLTPALVLADLPQSSTNELTESRRQRHYFTREALHQLIWTAPVLEVAERLGVSDMAVSKLCRRAHIPTPPRGYWARLESGQALEVTPLPPGPEGLPELLRIRGIRRQEGA
jgi:hypothetical protein